MPPARRSNEAVLGIAASVIISLATGGYWVWSQRSATSTSAPTDTPVPAASRLIETGPAERVPSAGTEVRPPQPPAITPEHIPATPTRVPPGATSATAAAGSAMVTRPPRDERREALLPQTASSVRLPPPTPPAGTPSGGVPSAGLPSVPRVDPPGPVPPTTPAEVTKPAVPAPYEGPLSGTLTYSGAPVVQHGEIVFRGLPPLKLQLDYDTEIWEGELSSDERNTQRLVLRNKKPGTQRRCVVRWSVLK